MTKVRHRAKVCLTGFARKNNNLSRGVTDKTDKTPIFRILFRDAYARPLQCAGGLYCKKSYKLVSQSVTGCLVAAAQGFLRFSWSVTKAAKSVTIRHKLRFPTSVPGVEAGVGNCMPDDIGMQNV
jgi:hypothetical protein